ncbi:DNA-binding response regulator [Tepidibacillus marianensis]|uniref:response regulator transcription factor n=1 Tax=Tepidibacillus marianensis TaxID=3131995 RepID=UPI0030CBB4C9
MLNILLLDDEPLELELLEFLIHRYYPMWKIYKSSSGLQAIKLLEQLNASKETIQLAFIDIQLPGKDGLKTAEELRKIDENIDFVIVSAYQEFNYAKKSIQLNVVDYLIKPVIEDELVEVLIKYLEKNPALTVHSIYIQQVIEKVKEQYKEQINLADIAKELHINASYLSRKFSEELNTSFSEYLNQFRIEIAKKLLVEQKNWTIQRVSEECGFNSQHYFSTAFKKLTTLSPKDYRKLVSSKGVIQNEVQ